MLKELHIKNFAIIDQLRVEFGNGLNVLTGETGAGKSIIVDALNLALGERASSELIRTGSDEAIVEAAFDLDKRNRKKVFALLEAQGIGINDGEDLIVRRLISASGKNKVYINGSLSNLTALSELGMNLADIHGQHEHQSLLSLERQLEMLDAFGELETIRDGVGRIYNRLREIKKRLETLETGERDRAQREEMLRFQKNEIDAAQLKPGEEEELANTQKIMANSEKLAAVSSMVDEILYSSDGSVLVNLKRAVGGIRDISAIDPRVKSALDLCESGRVQIEEAAREIASYKDSVEFDPQRMEQIGDRLDLIQKLKRKYGGSIDDILAFGGKAAEELAHIESGSVEIDHLRSEIHSVRFELTEKAQQLTKKRKAAAKELQKKVEAELGQLGMKKTIFVVHITQQAGDDTLDGYQVGPTGAEVAEFLISPNPGEDPKPLAKIASGGELSRIMLALKTTLVEKDDIPTLVFDEVDAGIGGAVADEVGSKLKRVAAKHQVFCITHLPQIASLAEGHYGVAKTVKNDRTNTTVKLLDKTERIEEISRMLGGKSITEATIKHAEEMLERGSEHGHRA